MGRFPPVSHRPTRQASACLLPPKNEFVSATGDLVEDETPPPPPLLGPCSSSTKQRGCDLGEISDSLAVKEPHAAGTAASNLG
jgi:hypothetical protein